MGQAEALQLPHLRPWGVASPGTPLWPWWRVGWLGGHRGQQVRGQCQRRLGAALRGASVGSEGEEEAEERRGPRGTPGLPAPPDLPLRWGWGLALSGLREPTPGHHRGMSVPWPFNPSRTEGMVACRAEALLWVGGSVAVSSQWQLGPLGKGAALSGHRGRGRPAPPWLEPRPAPGVTGLRGLGGAAPGVVKGLVAPTPPPCKPVAS